MSTRLGVAALAALCSLLAVSLRADPPVGGSPQIGVEELDQGGLVDWIVDNDAAEFGRKFGTVVVGQNSGALTIRVGNSSWVSETLVMQAPNLALGGADFSTDTTGFDTSGVLPGQTTTFTITFNPSSVGTRSGQVVIPYQANPSGNPGVYTDFRLNVVGEGVAAPVQRLVITEQSVGGLRVYDGQGPANDRWFGRRPIWGTASAPVIIVVRNAGASGTLNVSLPAFVSGGSEYELDTTAFATSLAAGASTSFSVAFNPLSALPAPASLSLTHNDLYETNPFVIEFNGEGTNEPERLRVADDIGPFFSSDPSPFGQPHTYVGTSLIENAVAAGPRLLGSVAVGNTSFLTITVSHGGMGEVVYPFTYVPGPDLVLGVPTVSGADFTIVNAVALGVLGEEQSVSFTVAFTPTSAGGKTAVVSIVHDDYSVRQPYRLNLTGDGVGVNSAPSISVSALGSSVSNGGTLTVAAGTSVAALALNITVDDSDGDACTLTGAVTGTASAGIQNSEFSSPPAAAPYVVSPTSGVFAAAGTAYSITLQASDGQATTSFTFAVVITSSGGGGVGGGGGAGCATGEGALWLPPVLIGLMALARRRRHLTARR
ncbi:MAG: choice-of-anchor D domain-containing protein [Planctomycetes bacterium]|nr:choice-of-anchor D domain-containing protein [Planctomycetota bacterium]